MRFLVLKAVDTVLAILQWAIFLRVILSWFPLDRYSKYYRYVEILYQITEPVLSPIRNFLNRYLYKYGHMYLDFSPLIAFLAINILRSLL